MTLFGVDRLSRIKDILIFSNFTVIFAKFTVIIFAKFSLTREQLSQFRTRIIGNIVWGFWNRYLFLDTVMSFLSGKAEHKPMGSIINISNRRKLKTDAISHFLPGLIGSFFFPGFFFQKL